MVNDLGDVKGVAYGYPCEQRVEDSMCAHNVEVIGRYCEKVYQKLKIAAESDDFLLLLGGDHSIPVGTAPAILTSRPRTGVLWVDAHADINTTTTSPSGNLHGMPVAMLVGLEQGLLSTPSFSWWTKLDMPVAVDGTPGSSLLDPKDLVYVGLRDVDPGERKVINDLGIKAFTMKDVDRRGIGNVMEEVCSYFASRDLSIHCSFDIDAIDPFYAPHTGTGVMGGLTFREANYIAEALHETGRLTSLEMVEINPKTDSGSRAADPNMTVELGLHIIGGALGKAIL